MLGEAEGVALVLASGALPAAAAWAGVEAGIAAFFTSCGFLPCAHGTQAGHGTEGLACGLPCCCDGTALGCCCCGCVGCCACVAGDGEFVSLLTVLAASSERLTLMALGDCAGAEAGRLSCGRQAAAADRFACKRDRPRWKGDRRRPHLWAMSRAPPCSVAGPVRAAAGPAQRRTAWPRELAPCCVSWPSAGGPAALQSGLNAVRHGSVAALSLCPSVACIQA